MARSACVTALAAIFSLPLMAWSHGLDGIGAPVAVAYSFPAPVPCVPVVTIVAYPPCILPPAYPLPLQPRTPGPRFAPPTAAPPSPGPSTPEPPLATPPAPAKPTAAPPSRSPGLGESTSFYDTYPVAPPGRSNRGADPYNVDFWNLTGKDLVLRINGEAPLLLPRNKNLPLAAGRQFTWQVEGHETQTSVQNGESTLQIVIRR